MSGGQTGMTRRDFVGYGTMAGEGELLSGGAASQRAGPGGLGGGSGGSSNPIGYFARFGVDEKLIRETLAAALSRGGDYADLFFQHRVSTTMALEDGAVNRAFTTVELGVGVRVVKGDQTGYAFTEELTLEAMRSAARTAAAIADGPSHPGPQRFHVFKDLPQRYVLKAGWDAVRPEQKLPILEGLNAAAFKADPRIVKASVTFSDEHGAVLVADSNGRLVEDIQPMTNLYLSCVAEQNGRREQNMYGVAGRAGLRVLLARAARAHRARGGQPHHHPLRGGRSRRPARCRWCSRRARRASCCTRRSATAWRPTSTARARPSTPTRSASRSRKPFVNIVDDGTQRVRARRHQRGRRGQRGRARRCSWRTASSPRTCTTPSRRSTTR